MARVTGCGGSVMVGTSTVGLLGIREWTLDHTVDIIEGRGFDDLCQPHPVIGMQHWSGNFRGFKDGAPVATTEFQVVVALALHEGTTTGQSWTGSAIITSIHPRTSVDGLVEYSYDFEGKGTLTAATA